MDEIMALVVKLVATLLALGLTFLSTYLWNALKEGKEILNQKMEAMRGRLTALQSCKIRQVLANAWMYRQEVRFATMVCDVLIVRGK